MLCTRVNPTCASYWHKSDWVGSGVQWVSTIMSKKKIQDTHRRLELETSVNHTLEDPRPHAINFIKKLRNSDAKKTALKNPAIQTPHLKNYICPITRSLSHNMFSPHITPKHSLLHGTEPEPSLSAIGLPLTENQPSPIEECRKMPMMEEILHHL